MKSPQPRESDVLKACTDLLSAKRIWWERRNTGAMVGTYKGKSRFTRFGKPGVADIMALIVRGRCHIVSGPAFEAFTPLWIETKRNKGKKQRDKQKEFQAEVEAVGMDYIVVYDVSQLEAWLKERGL